MALCFRQEITITIKCSIKISISLILRGVYFFEVTSSSFTNLMTIESLQSS